MRPYSKVTFSLAGSLQPHFQETTISPGQVLRCGQDRHFGECRAWLEAVREESHTGNAETGGHFPAAGQRGCELGGRGREARACLMAGALRRYQRCGVGTARAAHWNLFKEAIVKVSEPVNYQFLLCQELLE